MSDLVLMSIVSSVFMAVFAIGVSLFLRLRNDSVQIRVLPAMIGHLTVPS